MLCDVFDVLDLNIIYDDIVNGIGFVYLDGVLLLVLFIV